MIKVLRFIPIILLLLASGTQAQKNYKLQLQSGTIEAEENLHSFISGPQIPNEFNGYYYRFLQFNTIPGKSQQDEMRNMGLVLMDYIPGNAFMTAIPVQFNKQLLKNFGVRAVLKQSSTQKISKNIIGGFQDWAMNEKGKVDLNVQYHSSIPVAVALAAAQKQGQILSVQSENNVIVMRISDFSLMTLAAEPWVFFINTIAAPSEKEDTKGRSLHRSNIINSDYATGRHYDGLDVTVAIADDGFVGPHIDFTGRLTNFATGTGQSHGDMTSGICVGAGNLNPVIRGMATGAYLYAYNISGYPQIVSAVANFNSYGTVIASTSYSQGCNEYTSDTQFGDNLIYNNPQLSFVFSGGNSGSTNCGYGAGTAWGNITGGYKQGKNVVACGNLTELEVLTSSSSRGPSADGRIKPDICANGTNQLSTNENNTYQVGGGTSAASPGVAGVFAQLYQAYKSLFSVPNPPSALIKACALNTAEDIGNAGPDFIFGWGRINALRAVQTLEQNRFLTDSIIQGQNKTHSIIVPAGTKQIRVMVYWSDVGGSPAASPALVNNLNMQVADPSLVNWNPWVLDPTPIAANLNALAVRGVDSLNNMEQVTLDNPAAGTYTVNINGYAVPSIGQRYYLVWEFRSEEMTITYPNGGEGFVPGEVEVIRWDGQRNLGTYLLQYSTNNGSSWTTISSTIAQTVQQFSWTVPSTVTGQARIRISRNGFSDTSDSSFAIIGVPAGLTVAWACPDSMKLQWTAVSGAAGYTTYKLGTKYMEPIGTSVSNEIVIISPTSSLAGWFSVCANTTQGNKGRRAFAINKAAGTFACPLPFDARLVTVTNPPSGILHSCQNNSALQIQVQVENSGQNSLSNIPIKYRLNGGAIITEIIPGTLNAGASTNYGFTSTVNYSLPAVYALDVWVALAGDLNSLNDSIKITTTVFAINPLPSLETFQGVTFPPNAWNVENPDGLTTWVKSASVTGASGTSTNAATINNYSYNSSGAQDRLVSSGVSLIGTSTAQLIFDVAYARYGATYLDTLRIDISTDCGLTWQPTGYSKSDLVLATAGTNTSSFSPTLASQWRKDTVNLNSWAGNTVFFRFVNITGYGNNLYIDNVNISTGSSNAIVNVTMLIEGFHNGSGGLVPALMNSGVGLNPTECDTVTLNVRNALSPFAVVATSKSILTTSGATSFMMPGALIGNQYYIEISHRNAIQTWSANPVLFSGTTAYNFSTSASQAYGSNLKLLMPGVFALYSGDMLPKDEVVDIVDQLLLDNDIFNFSNGYRVTDLSGDGTVDIIDQIIMDNNISGFVSTLHP